MLLPSSIKPIALAVRAAVAAVALTTCSLPALAANLWQPVCPDQTLCATAIEAFVADGRVLMSSTVPASIPSQWVTIDTLRGMPTAMRDISVVTSSDKYLGARGSLFSAYDATGRLLYSGNHSSLEAWLFFEQNATQLGPTLAFAGTSPATVITGLTAPSRSPTIYLSRDEGQTVSTQTANIAMQGNRANFIVSANGQRVWVIPGPVTPGLWQTPTAVGESQLDFTKLTRVDDGSFPEDVVQFRMVPSNLSNPGGYAVALAKDGMYVSVNFGKSWSKADFIGAVDDIAFPAATTPETQVIAARGTAFASRDRGHTWVEMGGGLPADQYTLHAFNGGVVADGVGGVFVCRELDCGGTSFGKILAVGTERALVTEFHNTVLDHYFITADEAEKGFVRNGGAGAGWVETGQNFWAWTPSVTRESAFVCRFYGDPVKGPNSHFYSASMDECRFLLGLQVKSTGAEPRWNTEGYSFKVSLPADSHQCSDGLLPVYRAHNDGFARGVDSNHRFVLDQSLLVPLLAQGWKDEGVAFCVPANGS